jgi:hypothetical protein
MGRHQTIDGGPCAVIGRFRSYDGANSCVVYSRHVNYKHVWGSKGFRRAFLRGSGDGACCRMFGWPQLRPSCGPNPFTWKKFQMFSVITVRMLTMVDVILVAPGHTYVWRTPNR